MRALAMQTQTQHDSSGGRLVSVDGRTLPLKSAQVLADARGGLARSVLVQRFANPYAEPLRVTYRMPLPADGAVTGFSFTIGQQRIIGEIDRRHAARERFERALIEGRTAALVEQDRSSLFTQEVGNVPPGAEVICELIIDHKLAWLSEGSWEWRFPTVVAPRYLGAEGRVADAERVSVDVAEAPMPVSVQLSILIRDALSGRPESPSHVIASEHEDDGLRIGLSEERGARLDRDLVVRWPVAQPKVGASIDLARPAAGKPNDGSAFALVTLVPPSPERRLAPIARDLIVLLDTSGSMSGEPLDQARRVVSALVDSLQEQDRLELIEFSSSARRWKKGALSATPSNKQAALQWLANLRASGGTEMRSGIYDALDPLDGESQRQVVLVTDGLIGFEDEVIRTIREKLPRGSRVHTVGVGSGVNRSLTGPAARAGMGVEIVISLGEDPERAAQRIVARTHAPQVVDVELSGSALIAQSPERIPDLFAGAPVRVSAQLKPEGGELLIRGRTSDGAWAERLDVPPTPKGQGNPALMALFAREQVEDLELARASGKPASEIDPRIEQLGLQFQISTRLTSWIAITQQATLNPNGPTRREEIPQELPYGMSVDGLGLRGAGPIPMPLAAAPSGMPMSKAKPAPASVAQTAGGLARGIADLFKREDSDGAGAPPPADIGAEGQLADEEAVVEREIAPPQRSGGKRMARERAPAKPASAPPADNRPEPKGMADKKTKSPRRIKGRVVIRKDGEWIVELQLPSRFVWNPSQPIQVTLADGRVAQISVNAAASTSAGSLSAGLVIRVALRWSPSLGAEPKSFVLSDGDSELEVSL